MNNWRKVLSWRIDPNEIPDPNTWWQDVIIGPPLVWKEASKLLRMKGFSITFNYHNPGNQAVEISLAGRRTETPEEAAQDFEALMLGHGEYQRKPGTDMTPYAKKIEEFLQKRVSPSSTFVFFRGASKWLARFKIPFRDRYVR